MSLRGAIFAGIYDRMMSSTEAAGLQDRRRDLLAAATGQVLEIGGGTGVNLSLYGNVESLAVVEPEPAMLRRLRARAREQRPDTLVLRAPAEDVPFDDDSFDAVVSTLVLCSVDDLPRALREIRRVLRPGGRLLFLEHVRAGTPRLARWQDRLNTLNAFVVHGCNCNRATVDSIAAAGYEIDHLERGQLPKAPPHLRPLAAGVARSTKMRRTPHEAAADAALASSHTL